MEMPAGSDSRIPIRVGVTVYPFFVEKCAVTVDRIEDIPKACRQGKAGFAADILYLLQSSLAKRYIMTVRFTWLPCRR